VITSLLALGMACRPAIPTTQGPWPADLAGAGDTGGDTPFESVPASDDLDPSAALFDEDDLPHFDITLSDESWDALLDEPYVYVEGVLTYDGVEYSPVGVRTKGENSWLPLNRKPSLKVKMNWQVDTMRLLGLREITLNAMNEDHSMMHERVAYRLYREAGDPAARATHATVSINGESYGLYTHVETVDRIMMARWYDDTTGPMFEQYDVDYVDHYIPYWQLEFGDDDRTALQGVADALKLDDPTERIEAIGDWLDLDMFLKYWAVGAYVAQFDAYPYTTPGDDCHVFFDVDQGTLEYVPHGVDETFYYPDYDVERNAVGMLAEACRAQDACIERFRQKVWEVADVADAIDLLGYTERVKEQIAPYIAKDTHQEHGQNYIDYYQQAMLDFIEGRSDGLEDFLGPRQ